MRCYYVQKKFKTSDNSIRDKSSSARLQTPNYSAGYKFLLISFRCIDVPPVVERCEEKGGALEDKEENANKKEAELTKGENNRDEVESGNDKPAPESVVSPEHIELVKTTEQSRSENA